MRLAWIDAFSGVSGDMTLGALVDLGFSFEELAALPARLGLEGVTIESREARRGPFRARQVEVRVAGAQPHRHLKHVREILTRGELPEPVAERALAVFTRLAEAEGKVHGEPPEKVHFHEVGAADAIVDIAGACLGFHRLGVEAIYASPLVVGSGTVTAAHGVLPVPAPATALLLEGAPIDLTPLTGERTTPTGAALVVTLARAFAAPPPFRLVAQGLGAGGHDPSDRPNVLRILLGESLGAADRRTVAVVESTLDDASPQVIAHVAARLLEAGARDAFVTPVQMKKGRPGVTVTALCDPEQVDAIADLLFRETPTIGLRIRHEERRELAREEAIVRLAEGEVRLKVVTLPDGTRRARPEYESLAALSRVAGASLEALASRALAAFDEQG
ncbi:MAG: nickel pincer cofactor biosynthesis protein LarC [Candidatus Eisenbacteria bacterium]